MTSTNARAKTRLLIAGVAVLVLGVVAGAALWFAAVQRQEDAVRGLARAPIGCDTTLDFATSGTFLLFVETTGSIDEVTGDCSATTEYESSADELPSVRITMWDPNALDLDPGDALDLDRSSGVTYDSAGFVGQSVRSVDVTTPGDHVLRVESTSSDFVVSVGRDPGDGVGPLKIGAALAIIAGLVGGGALLLLSARKAPTPTPPVPGAWPAVGGPGWVSTPPVAPPTAQDTAWHPAAGPPSHPPAPHPPVPPMPTQPPVAPPPPTSEPDVGWQPIEHRPPADPMPAPGQPADGSTGDGERSPWAPPNEDSP